MSARAKTTGPCHEPQRAISVTASSSSGGPQTGTRWGVIPSASAELAVP